MPSKTLLTDSLPAFQRRAGEVVRKRDVAGGCWGREAPAVVCLEACSRAGGQVLCKPSPGKGGPVMGKGFSLSRSQLMPALRLRTAVL